MSAAFEESAQANQGLVDTIVQTVLGMLNDPTSLPQNFKGWIPKYIEVNPPLLPISQIAGFSQFTAQPADFVAATETTTSTTYGDLATVGPVLSGLPDGQYLFYYGCASKVGTVDSGQEADMSISVNASTPADMDAVITEIQNYGMGMIVVAKTLAAGGNNTVQAKYKSVDGSEVGFARRWMIGLRFANN